MILPLPQFNENLFSTKKKSGMCGRGGTLSGDSGRAAASGTRAGLGKQANGD